MLTYHLTYFDLFDLIRAPLEPPGFLAFQVLALHTVLGRSSQFFSQQGANDGWFDGMDLEVGSAVQTIACDLERPLGVEKATELATVALERQTAGRVANVEHFMKTSSAEATERVNSVITPIESSNSLMMQKTMIPLWLAQRSYCMNIGNTEMVEFYEKKLNNVEGCVQLPCTVD
jgi:hypothetical protein